MSDLELFRRPDQLQMTSSWLKNEAEGLRMQWIARNGLSEPTPLVDEVFGNLAVGRFWSVFSMLDGQIYGQEADSEMVISNKMEIAQTTFTPRELNAILELAIKSALRPPNKDYAWPGIFMGHDSLYTQIFEKKGSFLSQYATENVRRGLNNGRFWELLSDMKLFLNGGYSTHRIADVLRNFYDDLDLEFVPFGITLFERDYDEKRLFELDGLTNETADKYGAFIKSIDTNRQRLGLTRDRIAPLVAVYLVALTDMVEEDWGDRNPHYEDFAERLKDPWLFEYLRESDIVKRIFAQHLADEGCNPYGGRYDLVCEILSIVPDATELLEFMAEYVVVANHSIKKNDLGRMIENSADCEYPLEVHLGNKAKQIYDDYLRNKETRRKVTTRKRR